MKYLLPVGFIVAFLGFLIGSAFNQKELGLTTFLTGFIMAVIGMVRAHFSESFSNTNKYSRLGIKIGSIGFVISCIAAILFGFLLKSDEIANSIFYIGLAVVFIGIILMTLGALGRRNLNDR